MNLRRKRRSLFGSSRPRVMKEKARPSYFRTSRRRSQKVKYRSRYIFSIVRRVVIGTLKIASAILVLGAMVAFGLKTAAVWPTFHFLNISEVRYAADVPPTLPDFLGIKAGQSMLGLKTRALEKNGLDAFPELKKISITRSPTKRVNVQVQYREPLARLAADPERAFDETGRAFKVPPVFASRELPYVDGVIQADGLQALAPVLSVLASTSPDFYRRIKRIKTDRIEPLQLEIDDKIFIEWDDFFPLTVEPRVGHLKEFFLKFEPMKTPARLRFVEDDRLVMDANWRAKH